MYSYGVSLAVALLLRRPRARDAYAVAARDFADAISESARILDHGLLNQAQFRLSSEVDLPDVILDVFKLARSRTQPSLYLTLNTVAEVLIEFSRDDLDAGRVERLVSIARDFVDSASPEEPVAGPRTTESHSFSVLEKGD